MIGGESDEIQSNFWLSITKLVKPHVYGKRQTSNSSWEFLKIEHWADENSSKQFLWIKNCAKVLIYV